MIRQHEPGSCQLGLKHHSPSLHPIRKHQRTLFINGCPRTVAMERRDEGAMQCVWKDIMLPVRTKMLVGRLLQCVSSYPQVVCQASIITPLHFHPCLTAATPGNIYGWLLFTWLGPGQPRAKRRVKYPWEGSPGQILEFCFAGSEPWHNTWHGL